MRIAIAFTHEEWRNAENYVKGLGWDSLKEFIAHILHNLGTIENLHDDLIITMKLDEGGD